jgi:imidazolonepropionase-like amidohydrolase
MSRWFKIPLLLLGSVSVLALLGLCSLWLMPRLSSVIERQAPPQQDLAITRVQVWQGPAQHNSGTNNTASFQQQTVLVHQGRFHALLPANAVIPTGYRQLDGHNQYLLPGLIEAHSHILDSADLSGYLAHGVTTVRNMNGRPMHLQMKQAWEQGKLAGARLITAGPTLNHQSPWLAFHQNINSVAEANAVVAAQQAAGYDWLKVYDGMTPELFQALTAAAAKRHMPVAGHLPTAVGIQAAITGLNSLEHVDELWQNGVQSLENATSLAVPTLLAKTGTPLVTSLAIMQRLAKICGAGLAAVPSLDRPEVNPLARYFGLKSLAVFADGDEGCDQFRQRVSFLGELLMLIHQQGGTLVLGSDQGAHLLAAGDATLLEASALQGIGMSVSEVMTAGTTAAAHMLVQAEQLGQIKAGFLADAVLYQVNPMTQAPWQQQPVAVMVQGRWYDEARLIQLRKAATEHSSFWLTLSRFLQ